MLKKTTKRRNKVLGFSSTFTSSTIIRRRIKQGKIKAEKDKKKNGKEKQGIALNLDLYNVNGKPEESHYVPYLPSELLQIIIIRFKTHNRSIVRQYLISPGFQRRLS